VEIEVTTRLTGEQVALSAVILNPLFFYMNYLGRSEQIVYAELSAGRS